MTGRFLRAAAFAAALLASGVAWGQETGQTPPVPEPSADQRKTMAEIHRKMADCLASERPFAECRAEMRASCQDRLGQTACPMMGGMGMGKGHGRMGGGMGPGGMEPGAGQPGTPAPSP